MYIFFIIVSLVAVLSIIYLSSLVSPDFAERIKPILLQAYALIFFICYLCVDEENRRYRRNKKVEFYWFTNPYKKLEQEREEERKRQAARRAELAALYPSTQTKKKLIQKALTDGSIITFEYTNAQGETARRKAQPKEIYSKGRTFYVRCLDLNKNEERTFIIGKILNLQVVPSVTDENKKESHT